MHQDDRSTDAFGANTTARQEVYILTGVSTKKTKRSLRDNTDGRLISSVVASDIEGLLTSAFVDLLCCRICSMCLYRSVGFFHGYNKLFCCLVLCFNVEIALETFQHMFLPS